MEIIKSDYSQTFPFSNDHCTTWFVKFHDPLEAMALLAVSTLQGQSAWGASKTGLHT